MAQATVQQEGGAISNRRNLSHHLEASKLTKLGVSRSGLGKLISTLGWTHPWFYALGFPLGGATPTPRPRGRGVDWWGVTAVTSMFLETPGTNNGRQRRPRLPSGSRPCLRRLHGLAIAGFTWRDEMTRDLKHSDLTAFACEKLTKLGVSRTGPR